MRQLVPEQVFTQHTFEAAGRADFGNADGSILIESAYASIEGVRRFAHVLGKSASRGVQTCIFIEKPDDWELFDDDTLDPYRRAELNRVMSVRRYLLELGLHCNLRSGTHLKCAVVDYRITWGGSCNFLSYTKRKDEEAHRWTNKAWAEDTIRRRKLENCGMCAATNRKNAQISLESASLGRQIAAARKAMGLSQEELAMATDLSRGTIYGAEKGTRSPNADSLIKIFTVLEKKLLVVPADSSSMLERWLRNSDRV